MAVIEPSFQLVTICIRSYTIFMRCLIYLRCSTASQLNSIEIQRSMALAFCEKHGFEVIDVLAEVASGKDDSRPIYNEAIARCESESLVLVATKIDRLARRISTVGNLIDSGIELRIVSLGNQPVSKVILAVFSALAETERDFISLRTREALAHLKKQGVKLGNPNIAEARKASIISRKLKAAAFKEMMVPIISEIRESGINTLSGIALALNRRGYKAPRGGKFFPATVKQLIQSH